MTTLEKLKKYKTSGKADTLTKLKEYKQKKEEVKAPLQNDGRNRFTQEEIKEFTKPKKTEEKKPDNKLTLAKLGEAVKKLPKLATDKSMQQAARQPVWNAIDKVAAFNDVQGAALRKYAFGDVNNEATGNTQPTTGSKTADAIANAAGAISSAFLPSGGGAPSMAAPVRNVAEFAANKLIPKAGNVAVQAGRVAARGALESLPYTAQQIFVGKDQSAKDMLETAGSNLLMGVVGELGVEGAGILFKKIGQKLKSKTALTAKETAIVEEVAKEVDTPIKKAAGIADDADLQDVLTTQRPQSEVLKNADELRAITGKKPVATAKPASSIADVGQVNTPSINNVAQKGAQTADNVVEFKPKTAKQTKYVEQVTAKLPNDADGLSKKIAELETMAAKETDKSKLLKINLQQFAAKTKLRELAVVPPPINQAIGDISTARQKISYDYKPSKSGNLWEKTRTEFVDKYAALERLEKDVRGATPSAEKSLYKQARLSAGIPERANRIVESELKPIIKSIESKGHSYKDLGLYAEAIHAKDVNAAGLVSGFSNSEIDDIIQKIGSPTMEDARKKLVEYSNKRLQMLADNDVISQKAFYAMKDKWKNYMPLNRVMGDDKVEFVKGLKDSFVNVSNPIKGLKGSQKQIVDPIESMIKNTYKIEHTAGMNKVGGMLDRLSTIDEKGAFIRKLKPGEEIGRRNVVNVKVNGENVGYEVDPEVYKAMNAMGKDSSNLLIKVLAKPASVLRAGATLTVDFAARNPIRDVQNAFIVSKSGFNPFTDFTVGLASYIKKGKYYDEFLRNNGGYGNIISMDRQAHREAVKRIVKQTPTEKFVNAINPKSWLEVMRNISDATESATKIGEFRAALRSGATPQEAAYRARDLMDFARSGNSVKEVNKVVAFLNANIQGKSKMIRAIKEDPAKVSVKLFATMALPSIGAYAATHYLANDTQKATIKDAPDWLKDSFWLVPVPGTNTVARMPKPFEGAAVSNTLERFMSYVANKDKDAFDGFIKATVSEQSIPVMLSGAMPIIEGMTNYSFFRQAPIIPQREKYLLPKDQYDIYTSEVSKLLAGGVSKILPESNFASPRIMDNTIKGATAGLGTYALDATDKVLGKNKPAKNVSQLPGIKAFTVNENSTGKAVNFVYDEFDKLSKERTSYRADNPKAKNKFSKEAQFKFLNNASDEISAISKEIRLIQNDKDMTPKEKREKINMLSQKRNDVAREAQEKHKQGNYTKAK